MPARGTTTSPRTPGAGSNNFNPRARTGHDLGSSADRQRPVPHFNPRARTGHDGVLESSQPHPLKISIHVPARGTTSRAAAKRERRTISIHVPARGTTSIMMFFCLRVFSFQSTCPHGARRRSLVLPCRARDFNPRARTGHDSGNDPLRDPGTISIHVPARGTTRR